MRPNIPDPQTIAESVKWAPRASSWLGGRLLAERVPIASGRVVWTSSQRVQGTLTATVPRFVDGVDWRPSHPEHPLARYGQVLDVGVVVSTLVAGEEWDVQQGRFLIFDWRESEDSSHIVVTGKSMLQRVEGARFRSPTASRRGGTLASELRRLVPPSLGLVIDPGLADRPVPAMSWDEDRLGAVYEVADAWPARLRETPYGELALYPALPEVPAPVATLKDGKGGTVVGAPRMDTRAGAYNVVVARGQENTDAGTPRFQAEAEILSGPMAAGGDYGEEVRFFTSPLITSYTTATRSAQTMVRNSALAASTLPVQLVPDPRFELDDAVEVIYRGDRTWGWVTGLDVPLTSSDGLMRMDVGVAQ